MSNFGIKYRELSNQNLTDLIGSITSQTSQSSVYPVKSISTGLTPTQILNSSLDTGTPIVLVPAPPTGFLMHFQNYIWN